MANYPLHPGQVHAEPYYCTIPLEEYESMKKRIAKLEKDNAALEIANKNLSESVAKLNEMKSKEYELDMRERELKEQVHDYALGLYVIQAKAEKEARHQKYKRCLAMAKYCREKVSWAQGRFNTLDRWEVVMRWDYWYHKWERLADKFKETK